MGRAATEPDGLERGVSSLFLLAFAGMRCLALAIPARLQRKGRRNTSLPPFVAFKTPIADVNVRSRLAYPFFFSNSCMNDTSVSMPASGNAL